MEEKLVNCRVRFPTLINDTFIGSTSNKSFIPIWASFENDFYTLPCNNITEIKKRSIPSLNYYLHSERNIYKNVSIISGITNLIVMNGFIGQELVNGKINFHFILCKNKEGRIRLYLSHQLVHEDYWKTFYKALHKYILPTIIENRIPFVILDEEDLKAMFFEEDKLPSFSSFKEMNEFEEKIPTML